MKLADQTNTTKNKASKKATELAALQLAAAPKCSFLGVSADYYIGLSSTTIDGDIQIMGAVSSEMVETGILKLLGQGWNDITWPVVLDLRKKVLYHSYEAHKNGSSAIIGWQEYFSK